MSGEPRRYIHTYGVAICSSLYICRLVDREGERARELCTVGHGHGDGMLGKSSDWQDFLFLKANGD